VEQLGQVKRAYLEQTGQASIFLYDRPEVKPGLPLIPPWSLANLPTYEAESEIPEGDVYACWTCGYTIDCEAGDIFTLCPNCSHSKWTQATKEPLEILSEQPYAKR
jgi:hypothetical protein